MKRIIVKGSQVFEVQWSQEDRSYIGKCKSFPSLGVHSDDPDEAMREIISLVKECSDWLIKDGMDVKGLKKK